MSEPFSSASSATLDVFTEALASEEPTPGGGAAAAVTGSLAAALTAMVVRLSLDRPKYAEHADLHMQALEASDAARARFLELADEDAHAYRDYLAARRLPRDDAEQVQAREEATRRAARHATEVPLAIVKACHAQIGMVERLAGRTNLGVASDLEVAALLLESAARAAAANVSINLDAIGDEAVASAIRAEVSQRVQQIQRDTDRARERVARGALRHPEGS